MGNGEFHCAGKAQAFEAEIFGRFVVEGDSPVERKAGDQSVLVVNVRAERADTVRTEAGLLEVGRFQHGISLLPGRHREILNSIERHGYSIIIAR